MPMLFIIQEKMDIDIRLPPGIPQMKKMISSIYYTAIDLPIVRT
ncbi:hypothetical protein SAMN02745220_02557 [Desulfopila aestuarii DSM 18488]|uniref:Uncharacterized protein n=1 Tax=Desulfopila aestuarii DSM 18488 TaxID=1121416 RepID=A0A1M7Y8I8_9BACT|nr:hypothetical protein SAMN02745220_02557 [Desulfopila aestuarii DSM 18488]